MIKIILANILLFTSMITPLQQKKQSIVFFGDSLTAGYGIGTDLAFPALVEKTLIGKSIECEVVNAGLSGETSAGGLSRVNWILNRHVDVFILELGANDGLRGLPLSQTKQNLQGIIDKVKAKFPEAKIVIAGMMVPPNMGEEYSKEFKNIFPTLAKTNNSALIPFLLENVAGNQNLNQPDGIHPNARGHELVAHTVSEVLLKVL